MWRLQFVMFPRGPCMVGKCGRRNQPFETTTEALPWPLTNWLQGKRNQKLKHRQLIKNSMVVIAKEWPPRHYLQCNAPRTGTSRASLKRSTSMQIAGAMLPAVWWTSVRALKEDAGRSRTHGTAICIEASVSASFPLQIPMIRPSMLLGRARGILMSVQTPEGLPSGVLVLQMLCVRWKLSCLLLLYICWYQSVTIQLFRPDLIDKKKSGFIFVLDCVEVLIGCK
jgi:hypothetical protein